MSGNIKRLAVLESEWFPKYDFSVRSFIEGLMMNAHPEHRPDAFYYERYVSVRSFEDTLEFLVKKGDVRYLYLATHGTPNALYCPDGREVTRTGLNDCLSNAMSGTTLHGILLGSCLIGNRKTAEELLGPGRNAVQRLKWIAGYESAVDWMEGMLVDIYFLYKILWDEYNFPNKTPREIIINACKELKNQIPGAAKNYQFHVYVRQRGTGKIIDLFDEDVLNSFS